MNTFFITSSIVDLDCFDEDFFYCVYYCFNSQATKLFLSFSWHRVVEERGPSLFGLLAMAVEMVIAATVMGIPIVSTLCLSVVPQRTVTSLGTQRRVPPHLHPLTAVVQVERDKLLVYLC